MRFFYPLTVLKLKDNILVPNDARKRNLQNSKCPSLLYRGIDLFPSFLFSYPNYDQLEKKGANIHNIEIFFNLSTFSNESSMSHRIMWMLISCVNNSIIRISYESNPHNLLAVNKHYRCVEH